MSKKTKIILAVVGSALLLYTVIICAICPIDNNDATQQETEKEPPYIYSIDMYNIELGRLYGLNLEESFYIYVVPHSWLNSNEIDHEDISFYCSENDDGKFEIDFVKKCDDGSLKYKFTAKGSGNCEVYAKATYYSTKSEKFYLSIRDYKEYNIEYCCTNEWDYFHVTSCKIYQEYGLDKRKPTAFSRQELLEMGLLPCKDCCG